MTTLLIGLGMFLGVHSISIVAPAWRNRCELSLGPNLWRVIYSIASLIGFVVLIQGYGLARQSPIVLYVPPQWLKDITVGLMALFFPLLLAAYLPGRIRTAVKNNAMLVAVKLWATAHLLANGTLADVTLFGGFLVWAVAVRISLKYRAPRAAPSLPASKWNDRVAVVAGLALYLAFIMGLHLKLIGVPAYVRWP